MLEYNHVVKKRVTRMTWVLAVLLPLLCAVLLLSQTVFATTIYVINDGDTVLIHTSQATDPEAVLEEAGLELNQTDIITTRPGTAVSEITVQRSQKIVLLCGTTTIEMNSYGETVQAILDRAGIVLTEQDNVSVPLDSLTYDGLIISLTQTKVTEESYQKEIPYETVCFYDSTLPAGQEKVLTPGVAGQVSYTVKVTYVGGRKTGQVITSETVLQPVVHEIIAIGGEAEMAITITQEVTDALAQAAETGKPVILSGLIVTPGGELLSYDNEGVFRATAYHNSDPGCTIWTATGTLCRVGAIAVDPRVIPYGTEMFIISNDGKYIYGYAVAEDCGGSIKGNRIDLYFDTVAECSKFGIRDCTVYFLN